MIDKQRDKCANDRGSVKQSLHRQCHVKNCSSVDLWIPVMGNVSNLAVHIQSMQCPLHLRSECNDDASTSSTNWSAFSYRLCIFVPFHIMDCLIVVSRWLWSMRMTPLRRVFYSNIMFLYEPTWWWSFPHLHEKGSGYEDCLSQTSQGCDDNLQAMYCKNATMSSVLRRMLGMILLEFSEMKSSFCSSTVVEIAIFVLYFEYAAFVFCAYTLSYWQHVEF